MSATRAARHRMPGRLVAGGVGAVAIASAALIVAVFAAGSQPREVGGIGGPSVFLGWLLPLLRLGAGLAAGGCAGGVLAGVVVLRIGGGALGVAGPRGGRGGSNSGRLWGGG